METFVTKAFDYLKGQSLQVAVVFTAVLMLTWLLRNRSAHIRYLLWLVVAVKCLTPPMVIFSVPILPNDTPPVTELPMTVEVSPQTAVQESFAAPTPEKTRVIPMQLTEAPKISPLKQFISAPANILLCIWAAGGVFYLLWAAIKAFRLQLWLKQFRRPLPPELMVEQIEMLSRLWNRPDGFTVWLLDGISQPFVWGLWRGAIYLPSRVQSVQTDRQKAVVMHEMAHVVRLDAFINLLQILIQGLFWFHPLVWLANRFIRQEREKCCDETAIARLNTHPKEYGSAIIETLVQEYHNAIPIPSLAVAGPIKNIEDRIKTIMRPGKRFLHRPSTIALLVIGVLAAIVVPTTIALTQKKNVVDDDKLIMLSMKVKVVDERGNAIANAEIRPDGLRTTEKNSGHYIWIPEKHGDPKVVLTDQAGFAEISYPKYVTEKLKTGEVSFGVRHPEYCPNRIFEHPLKKQANPVVLKKGAIVRLSGYIGNKNELVTDKIFPQVSTGKLRILSNSWKEIKTGVYENKQIESGTHFLRLVHFTRDKRIYFSKTLCIEAQQNQISEYHLELKPGVRVEGLLDHSVPRPVTGGKVVAWIAPAMVEKYAGSIAWMSWTTVGSDGRFVFESLPPDQLQLTGLCDGFTAATDDDAWCVKPQLFALDKETVNIELLMKAAAVCEVKVVDKSNQPIKGATVLFGQNVKWQGGGTQLFPGFLWKSEDTITMDENEASKLVVQLWKSDFQAITNNAGIAVVRNLPGLKDRFHVSHDNYEMIPDKKTRNPEEQEVLVDLVGGQTTKVTVKMQKKWKWLFWKNTNKDEVQDLEAVSQKPEEPLAGASHSERSEESQSFPPFQGGVPQSGEGVLTTPSQAGKGKLEFRIVSSMTPKQAQKASWPQSDVPGYKWFPVKRDENTDQQWPWYINMPYRDIEKTIYLLVSDQSDEILTADGGWGLQRAYITPDAMSRSSVGFDFDQKGTELFYQLTNNHLEKRLAILIDGTVYSAPEIFSAVRGRTTISGHFDETEVAKLVDLLNAGMPPVVPLAENQQPGFNPIIEITINDAVSVKNDSMIDFDTGKLFSMPEDFAQKATITWISEKGIDAVGASRETVKGLDCVDMIFIQVNNSFWESIKASDIAGMNLWESGKPGRPAAMTAQGSLPATYLFGTRERGMGILQILGFIQNPNGIKIRYKMLQNFKNISLKPIRKKDVKIETLNNEDNSSSNPDASSAGAAITAAKPKDTTTDPNQPHITIETAILFLLCSEAPAAWFTENPLQIGKMVTAKVNSSGLKKYLEPISLDQLRLDLIDSTSVDVVSHPLPQNKVSSKFTIHTNQLSLPKLVTSNGQLNSLKMPEALDTEQQIESLTSGIIYSIVPIVDTQNDKINLKFCLRYFAKNGPDKQTKPDTKDSETPNFCIMEFPAYIAVPNGKTVMLYGPTYTDKDNKTGKKIFVQTLLEITPTLISSRDKWNSNNNAARPSQKTEAKIETQNSAGAAIIAAKPGGRSDEPQDVGTLMLKVHNSPKSGQKTDVKIEIPADLKKSLRTDKSWDTAFNEAIQVIQSRKNWPQTPEAVVKAYWNARAGKNYEEMRILWPGSGSWNWAQINDPDVKYVFGPASKSGTEVPYASENHFKQTGSYNLTMRLSYTDTKKGKRYYIWSGN